MVSLSNSGLSTFLASAARIASDVSTATKIKPSPKSIVFLLDVTATLHEAGDLLDVYIQDCIDASSASPAWNDLVRFTQVLGNGNAKRYIAIVNPTITPTTPQGAPSDAAMSAGVRQGPVCPNLRAKWVLTQSGDNPADASFEFSIQMLIMR